MTKKTVFNAILLCLALLLACLLTPCCALANSQEASQRNYDDYKVYSLQGTQSFVGAKMCGSYFGVGSVDVFVEIYDGIDFDWNSQSLTAEQQQTKEQVNALFQQIADLCKSVDGAVNVLYDGTNDGQTSDLWRYNAAKGGTRVEISQTTYQMLLVAKQMYLQTDGLYNPALFRLVDLWGFSSRFNNGVYAQERYMQNYDRVYDYVNGSYPLPNDKFVSAFANADFVDFSAVQTECQDGKYFVTKPTCVATVDGVEYTQWLDLGGIAKGYTCDQIEKLLQNNGIVGYYVSVGDSSVACGENFDGNAHNVSLIDPFDQNSFVGSFAAKGQTVSTSGVYRRFYTVDGQRFSHIISGESGKPTNGVVYSATVIAPSGSSAYADCLTTALVLMSPEQIAEFVNNQAKALGVNVVVLARTSSGSKQLITDTKLTCNSQNTLSQYANALVLRDGVWTYLLDAIVRNDNTATKWIAVGITLAVLVVSIVILCATKRHFVAQELKSQPAFRHGDVFVYFAIATAIVLLFVGLAVTEQTDQIALVNVVDVNSGNTLFAFDVQRNEWTVDDSVCTADVKQVDGKVVVKLSRLGETQTYNTFEITLKNGVSVCMSDAVCGLHKDCVNNFGVLTYAGQTIVCSPNGMKIVTE